MKAAYAAIVLCLTPPPAVWSQGKIIDFANEVESIARDRLDAVHKETFTDFANAIEAICRNRLDATIVKLDFPAKGVPAPPVIFTLWDGPKIGEIEVCAFPNSSLAAMYLRRRHRYTSVAAPPIEKGELWDEHYSVTAMKELATERASRYIGLRTGAPFMYVRVCGFVRQDARGCTKNRRVSKKASPAVEKLTNVSLLLDLPSGKQVVREPRQASEAEMKDIL